MATFNYATLSNLENFLTNIKTAYANNTADYVAVTGKAKAGIIYYSKSGDTYTALDPQPTVGSDLPANTYKPQEFKVAKAQTAVLATKATGDGNGDNIASTYLKSATAATTYVPLTRTIADVDLQDNITKAELLTALNVEDGAQVNIIESIKIKGRTYISPATAEPIDNKVCTIDLDEYAKKQDIAGALIFRGACTGDQLIAKASATPKPITGDVWFITADSSAPYEPTGKIIKKDSEYAWNGSVWVELGTPIDLSNYATKTEAQGYATTAETNAKNYADGIVATEAAAREAADTAISEHIDYLYKENGDHGYVAATGTVPASGAPKYYTRSGSEGAYVYTLASPQPAAGTDVTTPVQYYVLSTQGKIDARLKSLEGSVGPGGSVQDQIDASIAKLNGTQSSGYYVTSVTESAGIVTSVREAKGSVVADNTGLVDGGAVYSHVSTKIADLKTELTYADPKTANTYISEVNQTDGKIAVTRTALGAIAADDTGNGLVTGKTVFNAFDSISEDDINALFS